MRRFVLGLIAFLAFARSPSARAEGRADLSGLDSLYPSLDAR